jgi:hypothetical protein
LLNREAVFPQECLQVELDRVVKEISDRRIKPERVRVVDSQDVSGLTVRLGKVEQAQFIRPVVTRHRSRCNAGGFGFWGHDGSDLLVVVSVHHLALDVSRASSNLNIMPPAVYLEDQAWLSMRSYQKVDAFLARSVRNRLLMGTTVPEPVQHIAKDQFDGA